MEDIIELLREYNEPVPVPLTLPSDDELVRVEEEILISLPDELKLFLLEVSDVVYGSLEPVTVTDPQSHTYLPEMTAQAWSQGLPRYLIPICEAPDGYYCIAQDGEVQQWQAGEILEETDWPSIWHWAKEIWLGL